MERRIGTIAWPIRVFAAAALAAAALAAAVIGTLWLHNVPTVSAADISFHLSCPTTTVTEGDSFQVQLVKVGSLSVTSVWAYWHTDAGTAGTSDFTNLNNVYQEWTSNFSNMTRTIHTTADSSVESDETFTIRYTPTDDTTDLDDPELDNKCEITIQDSTVVVDSQEIVSTPPDGSAYRIGETIEVDVEFSAAVIAKNGPLLPLTIGGVWRGAKYKSGSDTTTLRFAYDVQLGDLDRDGIDIRWRSSTGFGNGKVKSAAFPDVDAHHYAFGQTNIEGQKVIGLPYVTGVEMVSTPIKGDTYGVGEVIECALTFSHEVDATWADATAAGTGMNLSGDYRRALYLRGSGTNTIVFGYEVQPDDSDTNGIEVRRGGYNDDGSTYGFWNITAKGTNKAAYAKFSALSNQSGHKVDGGLGPRVTDVGVASAPSSGRAYAFGETILVDVTFAAEVNAMNAPVLRISLDGTGQKVSKDATYHSGSGTKTLRFAYGLVGGDRDKDGLTIEAHDSDGLGADKIVAEFDTSQIADHTFSARNDVAGHRVYALDRPTIEEIEVVSTPWDGTRYRRGEQILINLVFSRSVEEVYWCISTGDCYYHPDLILHIGDSQSHTVRYAPYRLTEGRPEGGGTSGSDRLQFIHYVKATDLDLDGVTVMGLGEAEGRRIRIQAVDDKDASVDHAAYPWPVSLPDLKVNGSLKRDPLTAEWESAPESHNGSRSFSFQVAFSENVVIGHNTGLKPSLTVTNGAVTKAKRVNGRKDLWEVTVKPDSDADMTVSLRAKQPCSDWGAICASSDERRLSEGPELTVLFVAEPLTAELKDVPASHNGSNAFTFRIAFSEDIDIRFKTLRDHSLETTNGSVTKAKRVDGRNDLWRITIKPSSNADVTVVLAADRACDVEGAICTGRGGRLSTRLELTVNGPGG